MVFNYIYRKGNFSYVNFAGSWAWVWMGCVLIDHYYMITLHSNLHTKKISLLDFSSCFFHHYTICGGFELENMSLSCVWWAIWVWVVYSGQYEFELCIVGQYEFEQCIVANMSLSCEYCAKWVWAVYSGHCEFELCIVSNMSLSYEYCAKWVWAVYSVHCEFERCIVSNMSLSCV